MTKAAICVHCMDIVSPHGDWRTDRSWRWCECDHMAVRWRDGTQGLLEVTAVHGPDFVRVLGINNSFLIGAIESGKTFTPEEWRLFHADSTQLVAPHYLFHKDKRDCWALLVAVGESGDVTFVPHAEVLAWLAAQTRKEAGDD